MSKLPEVLDDLCSRFILNMPGDELASFDRLFFQMEQAHWFYLDFYRENNTALPSLNLKNFGIQIFTHVSFLKHHLVGYTEKFDNWKTYKLKVPVYGAIMLNDRGDKAVLVKGWTQRSTWGFPKGKVNKDEQGIDCAIREVYEETGYDFTARANPEHFITVNMHGHDITLFIIRDVPEDTYFCPRTRKEISKVEWMKISDLPSSREASVDKRNQFFMVIPFTRSLRQWLKKHKALFAAARTKGARSGQANPPTVPTGTSDVDNDLRRMLGLAIGPSSSQSGTLANGRVGDAVGGGARDPVMTISTTTSNVQIQTTTIQEQVQIVDMLTHEEVHTEVDVVMRVPVFSQPEAESLGVEGAGVGEFCFDVLRIEEAVNNCMAQYLRSEPDIGITY